MTDIIIAVAAMLLMISVFSIWRAAVSKRNGQLAMRRLREPGQGSTRSRRVHERRSLLEPMALAFGNTWAGQRLRIYSEREHPGAAFSEVFTYVLIGLVGGFVVGVAVFGISPPSILSSLGGPVVIDFFAKRHHGRRTARLEQQLPASLALQASSLRAGRSLVHSLRDLSADAKAPLSDELERVLREIDLGGRFEDAVGSMSSRAASRDFDLWVMAMLLHRTSGGDLTTVLDALASRLRERSHTRSEVMSLTAQGRLSGLVVALAPIAFFVFLSVTAREQMKVLYSTPLGFVLLVAGLTMEILGFMWIRWIVRVRL
ncbi:MAG: type II secretion system F family protein [Actinomycetota bacterium]|nr:type II secretion system F family protein [Actinomycetota bacterium]